MADSPEEEQIERCEGCGFVAPVDFLEIETTIGPSEFEDEAFGLCAVCSKQVRYLIGLWNMPHMRPVDGAPVGCALLRLAKFDDEEDWEQWVVSAWHAAKIADWIHSDVAEPEPAAPPLLN